MTFPNMRPARAVSDQMIFAAGQFVQPSPTNVVNGQIQPVNLATGTYGTPQLAPTSTISPQGNRVNVFSNPNGSQPGAANNQVSLPRGIVSGQANTLGSEFLLDFSAYNSDIIYASANAYRQDRAPTGLQAYVSCIDNVNKLIYVLGCNASGSAAFNLPAGTIVAWNVVLRDTFAP